MKPEIVSSLAYLLSVFFSGLCLSCSSYDHDSLSLIPLESKVIRTKNQSFLRSPKKTFIA